MQELDNAGATVQRGRPRQAARTIDSSSDSVEKRRSCPFTEHGPGSSISGEAQAVRSSEWATAASSASQSSPAMQSLPNNTASPPRADNPRLQEPANPCGCEVFPTRWTRPSLSAKPFRASASSEFGPSSSITIKRRRVGPLYSRTLCKQCRTISKSSDAMMMTSALGSSILLSSMGYLCGESLRESYFPIFVRLGSRLGPGTPWDHSLIDVSPTTDR